MKRSILRFSPVALGLVGVFVAGAVVAATTPTLTSLTLSKGAYRMKVGTAYKTIRPFGTSYTGSVWGKKISFGATVLYAFVAKSSTTVEPVRLYTRSGTSLSKLRPFYGNHYKGYNVTSMVQPATKKVYVAFGTKSTGASARIMEMTKNGLQQINNPTAAATANKGQVLVQFLKLYSNEYGLVTMIAGNTGTLKVWRSNARGTFFDEDTSYDTSLIAVEGNKISLAP